MRESNGVIPSYFFLRGDINFQLKILEMAEDTAEKFQSFHFLDGSRKTFDKKMEEEKVIL